MKNKAFAAIDLGTNSCRLLICNEKGEPLVSEAVSTRLGEGMQEKMKFTAEAVARALSCLENYKKIMDDHGVFKYRAIATAACRMASNGAAFVEEAERNCGSKLEVVDGFEEARLNLKGAASHMKGRASYVLIFDIGGGSTEITLAENNEALKIVHTISIPWGARNASEAFQLAEYHPERARQLEAEIRRYVQKFKQDSHWENYCRDFCCVATSSTPLRLAAMVAGHPAYDRQKADGLEASYESFEQAISALRQMDCAALAASPYVGEKRSVIFQAAMIIFETICRTLGLASVTASLKSAKDGIIEELVNGYGKTD